MELQQEVHILSFALCFDYHNRSLLSIDNPIIQLWISDDTDNFNTITIAFEIQEVIDYIMGKHIKSIRISIVVHSEIWCLYHWAY